MAQDGQAESPAESSAGVHRRTLLRTTAWSAPVVLATVAAPAMAASVGPLVVTATKQLLVLQMALTFTGGKAGLPVTIISVTTTFLGAPWPVVMSPTTVSSTGGTSTGSILSNMVLVTMNYTVSYSFNGATYTTVVSA